jgi:hypothetical protein
VESITLLIQGPGPQGQGGHGRGGLWVWHLAGSVAYGGVMACGGWALSLDTDVFLVPVCASVKAVLKQHLPGQISGV